LDFNELSPTHDINAVTADALLDCGAVNGVERLELAVQ
jgi:hypothetical protein